MTMARGPVIDFDHHGPAYVAVWEAIAADLHAMDYPMAWSPHHGGFWVLADWAEAKRVAEEWRNFSSDNDVGNQRQGFRGVTIPQQPYPLMLTESDPPLSTERRRIEMPFFTPRAMRDWEPVTESYLNQAIDAVAERGEADLVHDIVIPTTARTTLHILGFDPDNWRDAALSAHRSSFMLPDEPDYPHAEMARLRAQFRDMLADRRAKPRGDLVSALAQGHVAGKALTDAEGESMMSALVFGGFDTTTAAVLHALIWLDTHRDAHDRLLVDSAHLANAVEEFLRFFPPAPGVARNATADMEIGGRRIAKGDRIYLWLAGANRDPKVFPDPDTVHLDRANARDHLSFSAGGHRCLGSPLAKLEIRAMLGTMLRRLPGYRIDHAALERYPSYGSIYGLSHVPMTFPALALA
jgi:cytochrome P450